MTDMIDNLRSGLAALADEVYLDELRDRAVRTSRLLGHRRTVLAAVAVGVALGLLTTTVALALPAQDETAPDPLADTSRPPPPITTATPAPPVESQGPSGGQEIPAEAMLQPADVGAGYRMEEDAPRHHGSLSMLMSYCGQFDEGLEQLRSRHRGFWSEQAVHQDVYRYGQDSAAQAVDHLQSSLPDCQRVEVGGSPQHVSKLTLVRSDFAGMDSLLVDEVYATPDGTIDRYHVVVRQGDLYTEVLLDGAPEERAVEIANAAAERLCEGTAAC